MISNMVITLLVITVLSCTVELKYSSPEGQVACRFALQCLAYRGRRNRSSQRVQLRNQPRPENETAGFEPPLSPASRRRDGEKESQRNCSSPSRVQSQRKLKPTASVLPPRVRRRPDQSFVAAGVDALLRKTRVGGRYSES